MIKVLKRGNIFTISGHADYANYGQDIVCASVSSVVMTIVNCIMNIDKTSIEYIDDSRSIVIKKINDNDIVDILLNTMLEILKDLENQYKENIKVESEE